MIWFTALFFTLFFKLKSDWGRMFLRNHTIHRLLRTLIFAVLMHFWFLFLIFFSFVFDRSAFAFASFRTVDSFIWSGFCGQIQKQARFLISCIRISSFHSISFDRIILSITRCLLAAFEFEIETVHFATSRVSVLVSWLQINRIAISNSRWIESKAFCLKFQKLEKRKRTKRASNSLLLETTRPTLSRRVSANGALKAEVEDVAGRKWLGSWLVGS